MNSNTGIEIYTTLAHFYESIFSDGKFGVIHTCMFELYNLAAIAEARLHPDSLKAIEYFARAFEHKKTYDEIRCAGEYHCGAPLVSKAVWYVDFPVLFGEGFWQSALSVYPENLKNNVESITNGDVRFIRPFLAFTSEKTVLERMIRLCKKI